MAPKNKKPAPAARKTTKTTKEAKNTNKAKTAKTSQPVKTAATPGKQAASTKNESKLVKTQSAKKVAPAKSKHPSSKTTGSLSISTAKKPAKQDVIKKSTMSKVPAKPSAQKDNTSATKPKSASKKKTTTPSADKAKESAAKAVAQAVAKAKTKPAVAAPAKIPDSSPTAKPQPSTDAAPKKAPSSAKDRLRSSILARREKPAKPIAFTLDEIRGEIAATQAASETTPEQTAAAAARAKAAKLAEAEAAARAAAPNRVMAASLADILGFNPAAKKSVAEDEESQVPEKFRRYYKMLIDLRNHASGKLNEHAEDTLRRSAKDDAGDLSSYGQHMADAGTDTFDRDFALSMVASEQEALAEIEAAIQRIKNGTYGICEITQKPISKDRLTAVPFARYSTEAQKEVEKTRYRFRGQAGLIGELGDDGSKMMDDVDGDE